jgi:cytochrome c oxidase cbb3-type subunit 2
MYDHPFQWGSKRTGPDLARVGGRYSDEWHVEHLSNPQALVPESIMPRYGFLSQTPLDTTNIAGNLKSNASVGVPYSQDAIVHAQADLVAQATPDADTSGLVERYANARAEDFDGDPTRITEMDALVAYLQMLGTLVDFSTYDAEANYR